MLDRQDIDNLEFIGVGLKTAKLRRLNQWFSENDLKYLNTIDNIEQDLPRPEIKTGIIKGKAMQSNGYYLEIWLVLQDNTKVYVGSLGKFERLNIKNSIHYRKYNNIQVLCNEKGDILTI